PPVGVPAKAFVLAAAHMGDGIDETAVDERQAGDAEAGRDGDAISAVAVKQARRAAVERRPAAIEKRYRHRLAVRRGREDAPGDVVVRVVAGGDFLFLAE